MSDHNGYGPVWAVLALVATGALLWHVFGTNGRPLKEAVRTSQRHTLHEVYRLLEEGCGVRERGFTRGVVREFITREPHWENPGRFYLVRFGDAYVLALVIDGGQDGIIATAITQTGKILVLDSLAERFSDQDLVRGGSP